MNKPIKLAKSLRNTLFRDKITPLLVPVVLEEKNRLKIHAELNFFVERTNLEDFGLLLFYV